MTMQDILSNELFQNEAVQKLFPFIGALFIILLGVLLATYIAKKFVQLLSKIKYFTFLRENIFNANKKNEEQFLLFIIKFIYYIIIIFTIIAVAEKLGLTEVIKPLNSFLNSLFIYLPNVLGGIFFLLIAYVLGKLSKYIVFNFAKKINIDKKINGNSEDRFATILSDIVYISVFILLLPGVLSAFKLDSILTPISSMIEKFLVYLPNLVAAVIIFGIGWFIATKIRKVVFNLLETSNLEDKFKISENKIFDGKLSSLLSNIVYILILIPTVTASLDYLGLYNITTPIINTINLVFMYLPMVIGAIIILVVAHYFGKLLESIITNLLVGFKFDNHIEKLGFKSNNNVFSKTIGKLVKFLTVFFGFIQAVNILKLEVLTNLSFTLIVIIGNIIFGLFIILVGIYISNLVSKFILGTEVKNKQILSTISKVAILIFIGAMGLGQMGISREIINMAFGFTLGGIAIALAIAFGFGGRDLAAKKLEQFDNHLSKK